MAYYDTRPTDEERGEARRLVEEWSRLGFGGLSAAASGYLAATVRQIREVADPETARSIARGRAVAEALQDLWEGP
jgi:hypothetical protein